MGEGRDQRIALLVENETLVAMVSEDNLNAIGFQAICVETAADALKVLSDYPRLDLAIIDIGLPDMRGDALAALMRESAPQLPIVMASGYDAAAIRPDWREARPYRGRAAAQGVGKSRLRSHVPWPISRRR